MAVKKTVRNGCRGEPGPGRPKGKPNKTTALLKDAILQAATLAGGKEGLVGYLKTQAEKNAAPFLALLGRVLPMQITDADGEKLSIKVTIVKPPG